MSSNYFKQTFYSDEVKRAKAEAAVEAVLADPEDAPVEDEVRDKQSGENQ